MATQSDLQKQTNNRRAMSELDLKGHIEIHKIEKGGKYFIQKKQYVQTQKTKKIQKTTTQKPKQQQQKPATRNSKRMK